MLRAVASLLCSSDRYLILSASVVARPALLAPKRAVSVARENLTGTGLLHRRATSTRKSIVEVANANPTGTREPKCAEDEHDQAAPARAKTRCMRVLVRDMYTLVPALLVRCGCSSPFEDPLLQLRSLF
ncbi:hypothetical protein BV20DRAFT_964450 [Pilatotrama ljubarskyi]|nr:hypothetical protein BV20DRAFT_964450 [Pilatotrama ljubarskyi]